MPRTTLKSTATRLTRNKSRQKPKRRAKRKGPVTRRAVKEIVASTLSTREEIKAVDKNDSVVATTTITFVALNNIAVGLNEYEREGDSIFLKTISGRVLLHKQLANEGPNMVRWGIVTFPDGHSGPVGTDIFEDPLVTDNAAFLSRFRARNNALTAAGNQTKYRILMDETQILGSADREWDLNHVNIPFNKKVLWDKAGSDATGWNSNSVYLYYISNQTSNPPYITYRLRLHFSDH